MKFSSILDTGRETHGMNCLTYDRILPVSKWGMEVKALLSANSYLHRAHHI